MADISIDGVLVNDAQNFKPFLKTQCDATTRECVAKDVGHCSLLRLEVSLGVKVSSQTDGYCSQWSGKGPRLDQAAGGRKLSEIPLQT